MSIAAAPPLGGIVAEIGGRSRPLLLRNAEIERFEAQHDLGIFAVLDRLLGRGAGTVQARHVRDLVALGLVGAGMPDRAADALVGDQPPAANLALRSIAHDLVMAAFLPVEEAQKKSAGEDGSPPGSGTETDGTSAPASGGSPESALRRRRSGA